MQILSTIGYEGASLEGFLATLEVAGITTLIDVRELAMSRRKGFSKSALSAALEDVGIDYIHLRGLGDPKEGREAARSGQFDKFRKIFASHLKTIPAQQDLGIAASYIKYGSVCLLCYERNPSECHRNIVAGALSDILDIEVKHLGVQEALAGNSSKRGPRKNTDISQGAAARW